ncbi:MAG: restriction endonuclease subunit S [Deltaproteobacteria bacterium]|nr:restriction endonuclease subunit S [Deltaproteobacteria bacterium]
MNIKKIIEQLGFIKKLSLYVKKYNFYDYVIKIDTDKGKIFYRSDDKTVVEREKDKQIQLGDRTTSNLFVPESLVVLECVDRLLEKGYAPNDLHLEKKWKVGRGASGGKADINVYGKNGKTLFIIECKTWGEEFDKEKIKMEEHGGQLFSYLNQDKNAQFLVLYTSLFQKAAGFIYDNLIVRIKDRKEDLKKTLKQIKEENIKLYRDANNKAELFEVWKESFNKYFHFNGIFDTDATPYSLELKALKKKNLKNLQDAKGLFNKFAEILRHNNISDNANAFNRTLSLFLCKIVDEEKSDEDILDFQAKEDEEYEHIIDRLQALYYKGMKKLQEEIIYYSEEDLHKIIKLYPKQTPIEKVEAIFKELKYYTNNEFAFKEVHNKKLFIQNARVLVEVIKLIQNYKFRFASKQQVLGDFFELMLNHGVKQSQGQFFTPIPIVKYIIVSLCFENIIYNNIEKEDIRFLPKILDYACGAGHFLTESIEELQQILKKIDPSEMPLEFKSKIQKYKNGTEWAKDFIFGIEKDYRLARTSQIACYINGDGDANIIFGDGLEDHGRLKSNKKKFDIVITNPPYAVKAFKSYLNIDKTGYRLFNSLTEKSKEIEVLFIERTKQVLAKNGFAGIILPSTILTNTGLYSKAREILLKHFEIKAITQLGSKTFIATGTTTVILFLKRRNDDFLKDREYIADDFFNGIKRNKKLEHIDSGRLLKMFVNYRELDEAEYEKFLKGEISEKLNNTDSFKEYLNDFENRAEIKNYKKRHTFKKLGKAEQENEINKRFLEYTKKREKEKFLYFTLCLCSDKENLYNFQKTAIIKTGKNIEEQKEYLGYLFEGERGAEGLKVINYGGKMFDETDYENPNKACFYIRNLIKGDNIKKISATQQNNISVYLLADLINFNQVTFEKIIKENSEKKQDLKSKYQLIPFKKIATLEYGKSLPKEKRIIGHYPVMGSNGIVGYHNEFLIKGPSIIIGRKGSAGKINYIEENNYPIDTTFYVDFVDTGTKIKYFYYLFKLLKIDALIVGVGVPGLNREDVYKLKLPNISKEIQEAIVKKIENIEQKETEYADKIEKLNSEIFYELQNTIQDCEIVKLDGVCEIQSGGTPKRAVVEYWNGNINWLRSEVCQNVYVYQNDVKEKITELGLENSSAKLFKPNTILMALVGMAGVAYLTFEAATNQNIAGLYPKNFNQLLPKFLFYILQNEWNKFFGEIKGTFKMANLTTVKNLEIPLPSINEQKKLIAVINKKEAEIEKIKIALPAITVEKEKIFEKYL